MTVIGALRDEANDCTWLGFNDRALVGDMIIPSPDEKWVSVGNWAIGLSGTGPRNEVMATLDGSFDTGEDAIIPLIQAIRAGYEAWKVEEDDEGVKRYGGSGLIVHKDGGVWDHDGAFALSKIEAGHFWARGSGDMLAIGAAAALIAEGVRAPDVVFKAISIAIQYDSTSNGAARLLRYGRDGRLTEVSKP